MIKERKTMNFLESINYLDQVARSGSIYGTKTMQLLLERLGHPEKSLKVIHVAGTNGKGSVTHLLKGILMHSGLKVALYNSPYILSYKETITINGDEISQEAFAVSATEVINCYNSMKKEGLPAPTIFECITAIAFHYFYLSQVDIAIVEVGLGGLDDATNVFSSPLLSILTSISLDHTDILGDNLETIAKIKAGIIKENCPVILSSNPSSVVNTVREEALNKQADFYYCDPSTFTKTSTPSEAFTTLLNIRTPYFAYTNLSTPLIGQHQHDNIMTTLMAIYVLNNHYSISEEAIYKGIKSTVLVGRCEYIKPPKNILIDVAHNPKSIEALTSILNNTFSDTPIHFLFGGLADKAIEDMLKSLSHYSQTITITEPHSPRSMPLATLNTLAKKYFKTVIPIKDPYAAYQIAKENCLNKAMLCITGSFYLTIPLRKAIIDM